MNDKLVEICALHDQMYERMSALDDDLRKSAEIRHVTDSVEAIVKDVQNLGYTDAVVDKIKSCEALKEFCNVELCLKYKSVESLGEATVEAFKKFCSTVVAIVRKLVIFFQDVFNTTFIKCKQIINSREFIRFDKEANLLKKADLDKMMKFVGDCKDYLDKNATIDFKNISTSSHFEEGLEDLAKSSDGIIAYDKTTGAVTFNPPKRESLTLKDAGFNTNDLTSLASAFANRAKTYSSVGELMVRAYNGLILKRVGSDNENYAAIKRLMHTSSTMYGVMAKAQGVLVQQILAYWSCMKKDSDVTVPDDAEKVYVGNLAYDVNEDDIKSALKQYVTVYKVEIERNPYNGNSKGFAYVYVNAGGRDTLKSGPEITIKGRTVQFN